MKDLISQGTDKLSEADVQELNRRLLENSYSATFNPPTGDGYGWVRWVQAVLINYPSVGDKRISS